MKSYICWNREEFESVEDLQYSSYEYKIGETIRVNSNESARCNGKELFNGSIIHYFDRGRQSVVYPPIMKTKNYRSDKRN